MDRPTKRRRRKRNETSSANNPTSVATSDDDVNEYNEPGRTAQQPTGDQPLEPEELPSNYTPRSNDIIFERGKMALKNPGNIRYHEYLRSRAGEYDVIQSKQEKSAFLQEMVTSLRVDEGSKFVTRVEGTDRWKDIGDSAARYKVGHCIRDFIRAQQAASVSTTSSSSSSKQQSQSAEQHGGGATSAGRQRRRTQGRGGATAASSIRSRRRRESGPSNENPTTANTSHQGGSADSRTQTEVPSESTGSRSSTTDSPIVRSSARLKQPPTTTTTAAAAPSTRTRTRQDHTSYPQELDYTSVGNVQGLTTSSGGTDDDQKPPARRTRRGEETLAAGSVSTESIRHSDTLHSSSRERRPSSPEQKGDRSGTVAATSSASSVMKRYEQGTSDDPTHHERLTLRTNPIRHNTRDNILQQFAPDSSLYPPGSSGLASRLAHPQGHFSSGDGLVNLEQLYGQRANLPVPSRSSSMPSHFQPMLSPVTNVQGRSIGPSGFAGLATSSMQGNLQQQSRIVGGVAHSTDVYAPQQGLSRPRRSSAPIPGSSNVAYPNTGLSGPVGGVSSGSMATLSRVASAPSDLFLYPIASASAHGVSNPGHDTQQQQQQQQRQQLQHHMRSDRSVGDERTHAGNLTDSIEPRPIEEMMENPSQEFRTDGSSVNPIQVNAGPRMELRSGSLAGLGSSLNEENPSSDDSPNDGSILPSDWR